MYYSINSMIGVKSMFQAWQCSKGSYLREGMFWYGSWKRWHGLKFIRLNTHKIHFKFISSCCTNLQKMQSLDTWPKKLYLKRKNKTTNNYTFLKFKSSNHYPERIGIARCSMLYCWWYSPYEILFFNWLAQSKLRIRFIS